ncbi:MAG: FAD-binding protein [Mailhella sp.]|nr:FAD-binding protein [Mailhella sp.]
MLPISKKLTADVVIIGGGIAGAMAAIAARDGGAETVVVLEKANVRRSGSGATGDHHFSCYVPEIHGDDVEPVLEQLMLGLVGQNKDVSLMRLHLQESFDIVKKWEEWGINMRPLGRWNCQGHALPGKPRAFLKYDGKKQKAVLAQQMKKRGVIVLHHHPPLEIAKRDGRVCGVLALDATTPEPSFVLVSAASVIIATGLSHRLYINGSTPNYLFNTAHCPNNAGGQGLAWRVGAKMVNMELPYTHAGTKYFQRCGKATWIGVYRYPDGRPLGPFVTKPDPDYGDVTSDIWNSAFSDVIENGQGPAYMDCSENTPETLAYMREAMFHEGLSALVDHMDAKGIDPARHAVEMTRYEPILHGRGLDIDENGRTSVPGLYSAGDMSGNCGCGIGLAAWMGWRSGLAAAADRPDAPQGDIEGIEAIAAKMKLLSDFMDRKEGADWQEANIALTQIMSDYANAGPSHVRSQNLLTAAIGYLSGLKADTLATMKAGCSHTLMRASEVLDLFDVAESILHASLERKETRGNHKRSDYTFTNPLLGDKMLNVFRKDDGTVATEWRPRR